jgi:molybdopterin-guanine dinucleotide biosynthesis protein B
MEQLTQFPILQVVGYKNSGKTTLIQKLLKQLANRKYNFGVLKHHGHGGPPDINDDGTDTWKYRMSGASISAVEGAGVFQFTVEGHPLSIEEMISFFQLLSLDGLLIEGFKRADLPKVVMLRGEEDRSRLADASNVIAVISWEKGFQETKHDTNPPQFYINEVERYINYILDRLEGVINE